MAMCSADCIPTAVVSRDTIFTWPVMEGAEQSSLSEIMTRLDEIEAKLIAYIAENPLSHNHKKVLEAYWAKKRELIEKEKPDDR